MNFGVAMAALKLGSCAQREGWNGNGMHIKAQFPDKHSKMTHPYIYIVVPGCQEGTRLLPWQPAQVDLFAEDWSILEDKE